MKDKDSLLTPINPNPAARDGAALLDAVRAALSRYVVLPTPQAADAVTCGSRRPTPSPRGRTRPG
jgi:hypothetical protein